ncbi:MAG: hypothetical protein K2X94_02885 [Amoebophilaceae bacterium]|nr:hypothetical protein [Amoebophilaceae bacterium]
MNQYKFSTYFQRFYKPISLYLWFSFFIPILSMGCANFFQDTPQEAPKPHTDEEDTPEEEEAEDGGEQGNSGQAAVDSDNKADSVTSDANNGLRETEEDDDEEGEQLPGEGDDEGDDEAEPPVGDGEEKDDKKTPKGDDEDDDDDDGEEDDDEDEDDDEEEGEPNQDPGPDLAAEKEKLEKEKLAAELKKQQQAQNPGAPAPEKPCDFHNQCHKCHYEYVKRDASNAIVCGAGKCNLKKQQPCPACDKLWKIEDLQFER